MTNPSKIVRFTVVGVGGVYALVLYLAGIKLQQDFKSALAYLPSLGAFLVVAFDKWLWKIPLTGRLHGRPRIDGLWQTELRPDGESQIPDGGNPGPIAAYTLIEQSFWSICVTLLTAESASTSRATAFIVRIDSARQILTFTYDNEARREHLARSPRHRGACELVVPPGTPKKLTGFYFTDRFTAGEIDMSLVDRETDFIDFAAAQAHAVMELPSAKKGS